jgi:putative sterol carrier protein
MGVRYLSDEWISTVAQVIATDADIATLAASHPIRVVQVVTGGPNGDVTYHFVTNSSGVSFATGTVADPDITFTQTWDTAVSIASGTANAAEAFINGRVKFRGDHTKVIAAQPLFAALDRVFSAVRGSVDFR